MLTLCSALAHFWMCCMHKTASYFHFLFALNFFMSGLHLVLLPKDDDPSKAVLAACNEKELIRLAAQKCSTSTGNGLYFCYGRARLVTYLCRA